MSLRVCPKPAMDLIQLFCGGTPPAVNRYCAAQFEKAVNQVKLGLSERSLKLREYLLSTSDLDSCSVMKIHKVTAEVLQITGETIGDKLDQLEEGMHRNLCNFYDALPQDVHDLLAVDFLEGETIQAKAEKIQAAFDRDGLDLSGITDLFLDSKNLSKVPNVISRFTHLQWLDLSKNRLTELPDLSALANLQWFDLSKNRLTELPDLSALVNLRDLYLSDNQLAEAPDLSALINLEILDLARNQLTEVPDLSALVNLWKLDLARNQLTALPDLSGLVHLEIIYLDNTRDISIPVTAALFTLVAIVLAYRIHIKDDAPIFWAYD